MNGLLTASPTVDRPPREFEANIHFRNDLLNRGLEGYEPQQAMLVLAKDDLEWCFDSFFWTYDPRKSPPERPFILYEHERETLRKLEDRYHAQTDLLVEKSRDMGVSWTVLLWLFHHWRFDPGFQAIVGSRLEDLIDRHGELDTHFERLRWELRRLPPWFLPAGYDERRHCPYMRLVNPENGNAIVGEAVTANFSRQGRYNVAFLDEFANCEQAEGAWTATADSAPMRLPVSTPKGLGNKFAQLRRSGTIDVVSLHWSKHPEKSKRLRCTTHPETQPDCGWPDCAMTSPWYEAEKTRRAADPLSIAQELDIDYLGAGNPYLDLNCLQRMRTEPALVRGYLVEVDHGVEFRADGQGLWHIWEMPSPQKLGKAEPEIPCVVGADVAEGIGGDFSAACVRDRHNRGLKARIQCHLDTDQFAYELVKAGRFYHQAWVVCERNGPGFAVNSELVKLYGNVFYEMLVQKIGAPQTKRFGWNTNARTKELMLTQLREEVRTGAAEMRDAVLLEECKTLIVDEEGKVHADAGYHDDLVMAWAIAGAAMQLIPYQPRQRRRVAEPMLETSNLAG